MNISKSELSIMQAVWQCQPCSAEQILIVLNEKEDWHEKTAKTLLNRLLKKGALSYERNGRQYLYSASISENEYQKNESKNFVSQIFQGKVSSLVASFAQENTLSQSDVEELKNIISTWENKHD